MYLVPLTQLESVELLIHCLRAAAGEVDCTRCPAYRVCMKQCLTIADSVEKMLAQGTLPHFTDNDGQSSSPEDTTDPPPTTDSPKDKNGGLRVIK